MLETSGQGVKTMGLGFKSQKNCGTLEFAEWNDPLKPP
jgi:hypothetical protein